MAQVDKVKIGSTTYDIAPSTDATISFTSSDVADGSATSWTSVTKLVNTDNMTSIFGKMSQMFRNIRYLYAQLSNKANASHTHAAGDITSGTLSIGRIPTSNSQVNSTSYVPTSALIYSMNETISSLNDATTFGEDLTTTVTVGNLSIGTDITSNSTLSSIIKSIIWSETPPWTPNEEYESLKLGTWSSTSDVESFLSTYKQSQNYYGLKLGNYVTINDGTYNVDWVIAGFDMEHNQTAADGTVYDNGYGICMIPVTQITTSKWNSSNTLSGGYKSSYIHSTTLPTIANKLKTVLGDHLVLRNVLLSNGVDSSYYANGYEWTTAYCTLMSIGQMTGTFASNRNKYDDGEANYKLPLFNYTGYKTGSYFWSRGVWGNNSGDCNAWRVNTGGAFDFYRVTYASGVRPLIYIR